MNLLSQLRYAIHVAIHGECDKRAAQKYHAGYVRGAQDERSLMQNARLERELREIIRDSERPAA